VTLHPEWEWVGFCEFLRMKNSRHPGGERSQRQPANLPEPRFTMKHCR